MTERSPFCCFKTLPAIGKRFGLDPALFKSAVLKRADVQLLVDEKAVVMVAEPEPWPPGSPPVKNVERIEGWGPEMAKARFLARFKELFLQ